MLLFDHKIQTVKQVSAVPTIGTAQIHKHYFFGL